MWIGLQVFSGLAIGLGMVALVTCIRAVRRDYYADREHARRMYILGMVNAIFLLINIGVASS